PGWRRDRFGRSAKGALGAAWCGWVPARSSWKVPERAVGDAALPVVANPAESKVAVGAVNAGRGGVNGLCVESEEHPNVVPREGGELVELLVKAEGGRGVRHERALRILNIHRGVLHPGMAIAIAADKVAVVRPTVVAVSGAMRTPEAFALSHEIK